MSELEEQIRVHLVDLIGAGNVAVVDGPLADPMILEKRPTSEIKKAAREEGMRFLRESAVERVLNGVTTLREINKVTFVE